MLDLDLKYPPANQRVSIARAFPEIMLASILVVATKLCHPFDNHERAPDSATNLSVTRIDWESWIKIMMETKGLLTKRGAELFLTDTKVQQLTNADMDQYLDWYQSVWYDEQDRKSTCLEISRATQN